MTEWYYVSSNISSYKMIMSICWCDSIVNQSFSKQQTNLDVWVVEPTEDQPRNVWLVLLIFPPKDVLPYWRYDSYYGLGILHCISYITRRFCVDLKILSQLQSDERRLSTTHTAGNANDRRKWWCDRDAPHSSTSRHQNWSKSTTAERITLSSVVRSDTTWILFFIIPIVSYSRLNCEWFLRLYYVVMRELWPVSWYIFDHADKTENSLDSELDWLRFSMTLRRVRHHWRATLSILTL
jgi:hypothetical protein